MTSLYKRTFLNKDQFGSGGGMAAIRIKDSELSISDCNRTISLEFYIDPEYDTEKDIENIEYKIDTIYDYVAELRKHVKRKIKKTKRQRGFK